VFVPRAALELRAGKAGMAGTAVDYTTRRFGEKAGAELAAAGTACLARCRGDLDAGVSIVSILRVEHLTESAAFVQDLSRMVSWSRPLYLLL